MKLHNFFIAAGFYIFSITSFSAGMGIQQQRAMIASQIMQTQQQLSQKQSEAQNLKMKIKDLNTAMSTNAMRSTHLILLKTQITRMLPLINFYAYKYKLSKFISRQKLVRS